MGTALAPPNLNEQVYDTLKQRLIRRELPPGSKVSLHELAAELGVSRSPVHHALTRLVQDGLLTVRARRGYYVTPVTADALRDGYDVRLAIELHAAETAVGRVPPEALAGFRSLLLSTAAALGHGEAAWDEANAAFHEYQVDLAGNGLLSAFYRDLSVNLMMQVIRGGRIEAGAYLAEEHEAIVSAFERADAAAAQQAIRTHIASGLRIALESLESAGGAL
jgi:DNA-binding GntR family transcriptional regulator